MNNEIAPAFGGPADETGDERAARNVAREVQLLREQLLEPPRPRGHGRLIVSLIVFAIALAVAGFVAAAVLA